MYGNNNKGDTPVKDLIDAIANMNEPEAMELAEKMIAQGEDPLNVLELCRQAVETVGRRFERGQYFLPELIMAGEMLKKISTMAEPFLNPDAAEKPKDR